MSHSLVLPGNMYLPALIHCRRNSKVQPHECVLQHGSAKIYVAFTNKKSTS